MKSLFSELIRSNPSSWRNILKENYPKIWIIENDCSPYVLFKYGVSPNFKDPMVQEARGIILNKVTGKVVCWPFRKFGRYDESYADKIDWSTAKVLEKIDGSIIKLWYDEYKNKFVFSTDKTIYAEDALIEDDNGELTSFLNLIEQSDNYKDICKLIENGSLDKNNTYIFELVNQVNQVVIHYNDRTLYHIGTRNNVTGEETNIDIGIHKPEEYPVKSLQECIKFVDNLTADEYGHIYNCFYEGAVVVDANWNRVKVKTTIYQVLHNIVSGSTNSRKDLIRLLYDDKLVVSSICTNYPELAHYIKYYDYMVTRFKYEANAIIDVARKIYEDSDHSRKMVGLSIGDSPYKSIVFRSLDNDYQLDDILEAMSSDKYLYITKFIEPYTPNRIDAFDIYYNIKKGGEK